MVYRGNGAAIIIRRVDVSGKATRGWGGKLRLLSKAINLFALQGDAYDLISG